MTFKRLGIPAIVIAVVVAVTSFVFAPQSDDAKALSGSEFNPGRIIDDSVFYNSQSMTKEQVQKFLESKVPNCDYNGTQPASDWGYPNLTHAKFAEYKRNGTNGIEKDTGFHAPPYKCLTRYSQTTPQMEAASGYCGAIGAGTRTAAQIITDVAKACGINPQVLIVLLEKEQSLVTDSWPLNRQLRSATGFACSDSAPCNRAYEGFFYQVYNAARQFKVYKVNPNNYNYVAGRNNRVYWQTNLGNFVNPTGNENDPSRNGQSACGYKNVYIQNQATAALYIYTPYQPNQKALANLHGKGDGCSAHGNRNFWRFFSDWFGSTLANSFIKYTVYNSTTDTSGTTATIGISLSNKPTANVSIQYGITSPSNAAFIGSSKVTIKPSTWNSPELNRLKIKGLANDSLAGNIEYQVRASRPVSTDKRYSYISGDKVGHVTILHQDVSSNLPVYQLYSPTKAKHYYTANLEEKKQMQSIGFEDRGIGFYYCSAGNTQVQSLSRNDKEQRLEIIRTQAEKTLTSNLFEKSGVGFSVSSKGTVPVYRHYNSAKDHSFYSISPSEATGQGYASQGIAFMSCRQGDIPVYRLYKPSTGSHYYTISPADRDKVIREGGYVYQDVAYYIEEGSLDVFRAYKPATGRHYYTTSQQEIDLITKKGGYVPQGVSLSISK